jgi:hypothetical protein
MDQDTPINICWQMFRSHVWAPAGGRLGSRRSHPSAGPACGRGPCRKPSIGGPDGPRLAWLDPVSLSLSLSLSLSWWSGWTQAQRDAAGAPCERRGGGCSRGRDMGQDRVPLMGTPRGPVPKVFWVRGVPNTGPSGVCFGAVRTRTPAGGRCDARIRTKGRAKPWTMAMVQQTLSIPARACQRHHRDDDTGPADCAGAGRSGPSR